MIKRFSHLFAWLLLVLMPLQAFAAANMLVCNSMMQAQNTIIQIATKVIAVDDMANMPCHKTLASEAKHQDLSKEKTTCKMACKMYCATVCASSCALTAVSNQLKPSFVHPTTEAIDFNHQIYASITQASLQRPPIFFI